MISDTRVVGLKPTWKGNLCMLLLVAVIVSVSTFLCSLQNDWPSGLRARVFGHTFLAFRQHMWVIRGIKGEWPAPPADANENRNRQNTYAHATT
jgi:hypothetical protein